MIAVYWEKFCRATWDIVRDLYALEIDRTCRIPAMIGAIQTFNDLIHLHSHVHAAVCEGIFSMKRKRNTVCLTGRHSL